MRVTDSMLYDMSRTRLSAARTRAAEAQERAATGQRVRAPSDDPTAAALARRESARIAHAEAALRTTDAGLGWLEAADGALDSVESLLSRARELAVGAANGTMNADARSGIAREIEQIRAAVVGLANTEAEGSYVFAGFADNIPPFIATGAYVGDGQVREVEPAPGMRVGVGVSGATTFGVGGAGGTDILATLESLRAALDSDDVATIGALLDPLSSSISQIADARTTLGANMQSLETMRSVAERRRDRATADRADLVEVDPYEAFSELSRAENALQAAVKVAAELPMPGLLDRR